MTCHSIRQKSLVLLVFVAVGFLLYSNTFDASFHFDDERVVSDLTFEKLSEKCKGGCSRVVGDLTFLLNYRLGGANVFGYHLFNTFIHIGAAFFVYLFLYQILSLANWPAFFGGLLFLVHPMATQAVTYITQRYTSLAGFFYIGSLAFFVSARENFRCNNRFFEMSHFIPYICSLVMAVLALHTKEMAITLPVAILLTEYYFMESDLKAPAKRILYLLPFLSSGLIIPLLNIIELEATHLDPAAALQGYTWGPGTSRSEYLFTQFKIIIAIYLKLIVWPVGQNIDHDYIVSKSFVDPSSMASFLALCVMFGLGLWLFRHARLVSFGILWFFVTISPTSSIVPNYEFVAEHRVYISLMGFTFALAGLPQWQARRKQYLSVLLPILLILSGLTYVRNTVWQTDLTLWEDSVAKSPGKIRPHNNLANALFKHGRLEEAVSHLSEALSIKPDYADAQNNLGNALLELGRLNEAIAHFSAALDIAPTFAQPHNNLGVLMVRQGRLEEAASHLSQALRIEPDYADAHNNLGVVLANRGRIEEAINHFSEALRIKPDYVDARSNLQTFSQQIGD